MEKEERREDGGLREVESGPKSVFLNVAGNKSQRKDQVWRIKGGGLEREELTCQDA